METAYYDSPGQTGRWNGTGGQGAGDMRALRVFEILRPYRYAIDVHFLDTGFGTRGLAKWVSGKQAFGVKEQE